MSEAVVETIQDAIYFVNDFLAGKDVLDRIPDYVLAELFEAYIPNHLHIYKALIRKSGRPPKGSLTKVQAIRYISVLTANTRSLNAEEKILYAVLLKYQTSPQGNAVDEYWNHKLMEKLLADTFSRDEFFVDGKYHWKTLQLAAELLAAKLNEKPDKTGHTYHPISLLRSYLRVERRKERSATQ